MHQGWRIGHEKGFEIKVFEDDFINGTLNRWKREEGFGEEKGGVGRVDFEDGSE